ncbi:thioesterase family protein [Mycobacterium sp. MYCO198283]|uniref:acyl-CoA thioesterase n=1 Tax=Mycobacterium sp. MYCO198283 TaxID=2883505 RepID=UPI001E35C30C|nr:acyl-CoA thioesterase domain-containing protein [Mycobacterium sp. MYCO198283]MCG5432830.1 thioesterase family protein [Mycobacterium sp. MYCO198283]
MAAPDRSWLAALMSFRRDGGDVFTTTPSEGPNDRLFGGMVAAQALAAAGATVESAKHPQSLHAYFLRGGRYDLDVEFHVARSRDGRSFDTRQVTAVQGGAVILELLASFHAPEPGTDWYPAREPGVTFDDAVPKSPDIDFGDRFDIRTRVEDTSVFAIPPFWIRSRAPIEDDPLLRACALTFMSDLGPVPAAAPPDFRHRRDKAFATTLDHAVWFHRPTDPAEWHRYEVDRVNHNDSRGLVVGSFYDAAGRLIASMTQEALWRR